ncbi:DUF2470 domain-containing protein [Streptomyces sp. UH6]|uniref:DUF2470 domain-containing protein n=1 Tax=Streptomyces sp. UH6 TaxID=2748379 RepID=UPI0015D4ADE5|nr:DUF2470 domain-containing protein [Streptomyces sp. UH6]NYV78138.1 DUF2470 domain-containing protein [Streptomyces sp. UH6]
MRLRTAHATRPTPAERTRSVITAAHSMTVVVDGRRHDVHSLDGTAAMRRIHLHAPTAEFGDGDRAPRVPVRVELTDIAPTPVRDRLRARVTLTGLMADPFDPDSAASTCMRLDQAVHESAGARAYVPWSQLEAAEPDPLATREASLLGHLVAAHSDLVALLLRLVEPEARRGLVRALPVLMDRYGITLRLEYAADRRDVRLPFPTPVGHADQVGLQMHALLAAGRRASHSGTTA